MTKIIKVTSIVLIQVFLAMNFAWCRETKLLLDSNAMYSATLAPEVYIDVNQFSKSYHSLYVDNLTRELELSKLFLQEKWGKSMLDEFLGNKYINIFFERDRAKHKSVQIGMIYQVLSSKNEIVSKVIADVNEMTKKEIKKQGQSLLDDFNDEPVNKNWEHKKVSSWGELVMIDTIGDYDIHQLLGHTLGIARQFLEIMTFENARDDYAENKKVVQEYLYKGMVILRAIAIEAKESEISADREKVDFEVNKNEMIDNSLINLFFWREQKKGIRESSIKSKINQILKSDNKSVREIISFIESKGDQWIESGGKELLERFNREYHDKAPKRVHTWAEFIVINTSGRYDINQLFAGIFGPAYTYFQLFTDQDIVESTRAESEEAFKDFFVDTYTILRAIAIEARSSIELPVIKKAYQEIELYELIERAI